MKAGQAGLSRRSELAKMDTPCARDAILIPSAPASVSATLAALPSTSLVPLASLKLTRLPAHSLLYLVTLP